MARLPRLPNLPRRVSLDRVRRRLYFITQHGQDRDAVAAARVLLTGEEPARSAPDQDMLRQIHEALKDEGL